MTGDDDLVDLVTDTKFKLKSSQVKSSQVADHGTPPADMDRGVLLDLAMMT